MVYKVPNLISYQRGYKGIADYHRRLREKTGTLKILREKHTTNKV